ncbi:GldM family protein [Kordia jejudonensis]|uniref:GldM family protein n=1 Tax=Kordia jejudonensis TaxID=1348245 RepID=UPI0006296AF9|nr:GldM family protein [Kordia jejudonensis]
MKYTFNLLIIFLTVFVSCTESQHNNCVKLQEENAMLKDSLATLQQFSNTQPEAIVELKKMNIVYRGVDNPLKIVVPNAKNVAVMAPGLLNKGNGNFNLKPQSGNEVTLKIVAQMHSGKQLTFEKVLRIEDVENPN